MLILKNYEKLKPNPLPKSLYHNYLIKYTKAFDWCIIFCPRKRKLFAQLTYNFQNSEYLVSGKHIGLKSIT
jgi:hypothetical protein